MQEEGVNSRRFQISIYEIVNKYLHVATEIVMGIARFTVTVVILIVLSASVALAGGFANTGLGIHAQGMGGAYRAIASDWSAAYYNVAGYANMLDNQLGFTVGLTHNRNELTPDYYIRDDYGNSYGTGIVNGATLFNKHIISDKPAFGMAIRMPIWGETVFGLSAFQLFDQTMEWKLFDPDVANFRAYNDSLAESLPNQDHTIDLDVVAFQLTVAREFIPEKLSLGIGLQLLRGDLVYEDLILRETPLEGDAAIRPYDHIPEFASNDGKGYGFGATAGLMWKPTEKMTIGISGKLPAEITIKGNTNLEFYLPKNYNKFVDPKELNSVENMFFAGNVITLTADMETKLKLPGSIGLGVAYDLTDKLTVALDAEYTLWSSFEGLEFTYSNIISTSEDNLDQKIDTMMYFFGANTGSSANWENTGKLAFGLSYDLTSYATFLAGTSYDQSPLRKTSALTAQFMDTGDKLGLNSGFLFHANRWDLGVVTSYTNSSELSTSEEGSLPGDYKASAYETVFSLSYRF